MRKYLLIAAIASAASVSSQAATVLGFDIGGYAWQTDFSGTDSANNNFKGDGSSTNSVLFAALEHPVPILPNIRITRTNLTQDFKGTGSVDAGHTDATLYYEVLDNVVSLDLGLAGRKHDGEAENTNTDTINSTLGMGYLKLQFDVPGTGLGLGAEYYGGRGAQNEKVSDMNAFIHYNFFMGFNIGAGYRRLDTDLEINKDIVNLQFDGAYVSAFYHF